MVKRTLAYYLGTTSPEEDKKRKQDKRVVVRPGRFSEPMYSNYDLYETPEGDRGVGPGVGISGSRKKYKSVKEFIDDKRKRNKNKYVAPKDEYYADDKKAKKSLKSVSSKIDYFLIKTADLDFSVSNPLHSFPSDEIFQENSMNGSIAGMYDHLSPNRLIIDSVSPSDSIKWIKEDEDFAKARKRKAKKKKIKRINSLLDRMVGRSFYGYPYGYGNHNHYDNRSYTTNNDNDSPSEVDSDVGDGGGDAGGGDGGGGE